LCIIFNEQNQTRKNDEFNLSKAKVGLEGFLWLRKRDRALRNSGKDPFIENIVNFEFTQMDSLIVSSTSCVNARCCTIKLSLDQAEVDSN